MSLSALSILPIESREEFGWKFDLWLDKTSASGCWLWTGPVGPNGYAEIPKGYGNALLHRLAYKIFIGELEPGLQVLHSCDTRRCCNPAHLRQGTYLENMHDKHDRVWGVRQLEVRERNPRRT